ncbi:MAG: xylulokinase [Pirellulaceae bacterium]
MPSYLLAHDLGTSGDKATLFSEQGRLIASCTRSYDTHYFHGNWAEQNPADWWGAVCATTRQLLADIDPATIACVTLSGQMMGCTPVDRQGKALRPSILYCDQRSEAEASQLRARIALTQFYQIVGHRISSSYSLEKLMWLKAHEADVYRRTYRSLCAKDYINFQLTGQFATDFSDASGTNAFDLNTFTWSDAILELAEIERDKFPVARASTDILGSVTAEAARVTGLLAGTPVAVGGGDGSCAGVGVGCVTPGSAYNYLGSSSWIALTVKQPIVDPQMRTMNWAHCVPGYLHPSGTMQAAGASYQWLKNTLCGQESAEAATENGDVYELINQQIAQSPPGARGVIFLPYMLGERTPRWNPQAKGAFVGLNLATSRADMLRAVMEGISMNLGLIVEIFRQHVPLDCITVIGGGAKGAVWRQMLADIYNCRIEKPNYLEEATSMGAAVIGGVAVGMFDSFDVIDRFIRIEDVVEPIADHQAVYRRIMPVFDKCYHALVEVFTELSQLD